MFSIRTLTLSLFLYSLAPLNVHAKDCESNFGQKTLFDLKAKQFSIEDESKRNKTAVKLLSCLGHKDPDIRDGVVYEGLSHWLRDQELEEQTIKVLFESLVALLNAPNQDKDNYTQPFASLVLAEVVRVDRITPYLTAEQRQQVVDTSTQYMEAITDHRGFDNQEGWRHAVAHTSDIFLQLALNPNISKTQLDQLLSAIVTQVSPANEHSYIHGEPKRLATAFAYIALREEQAEQTIVGALDEIANPKPFANWGSVYKSESGLAKLHNTRAFIYSLFALSNQSKNPNLIAIQPALIKIIRELG